jgi:D-alanine-D-alanine ligase
MTTSSRPGLAVSRVEALLVRLGPELPVRRRVKAVARVAREAITEAGLLPDPGGRSEEGIGMAHSVRELEICVLTGDPRLPDATKRGHRYNEEDFATHRGMREALESLPGFRFGFLDDHSSLFERLSSHPPDLVLNFCDTGFRNQATQELHVPALLEMLGVAYSGAPPAAMAICYDKQIVRRVAEALGIPVPRETYLAPGQDPDEAEIELPALIKPNQADGSVGITKDSVVRTRAEAMDYLNWLHRELPGRAVLVQEYLLGPEYGVGLIGNPEHGLTVLPALEVDFSRLPAGLDPILSFESKAIPDSPYWTDIKFKRAEADPAVLDEIADHAKRLFARLGCRDYARFDFRCAADGRPRLMEVNPNPAWAYDGKLAFMAGFAGIAYPAMLEMILDAALRRTGLRPAA